MVLLLAAASLGLNPLPEVQVTHDNTRVTTSCVLRFPEGVIHDADGNGVVQIEGENLTVEFAPGARLRGADAGEAAGQTPWDQLTGVGIVCQGAPGLTLRGASIEGFKVGLLARRCDGLTIDDAQFADIYRQRLASTPDAEDASDWLWPHENDAHEWRDRYGAALVVESSAGVTIRHARVRRSQNGIILDRVRDARVQDCDASFLSGWGLALWRTTDSTISRNAFDYCVRGHSEGVYNRGQDSAGILCFEQSSRNNFIENSATHSGDGFFGFAGKESIGEKAPSGPTPPDAGCNDNELRGNDFSFNVAHGLELTFSTRNVIRANTFIANGACGIWGGYSTRTVILDNHFERNGELAFGLENGAIDIEHGAGNRISVNDFINNRTAIHLWWDDDASLLALPGVKSAAAGDVIRNAITGNTFVVNADQPFGNDAEIVVLRLRGDPSHLHDNDFAGNTVDIIASPNAREFDVPVALRPRLEDIAAQEFTLPEIRGQAAGDTAPTDPNSNPLASAPRAAIVMGPWGPWEHQTPMARLRSRTPAGDVWELFPGQGWRLGPPAPNVTLQGGSATSPARVTIAPIPGEDVTPYRLHAQRGDASFPLNGEVTSITWDVRAFAWDDICDPRAHLDAFLARAHWDTNAPLPSLLTRHAPGLDFQFNDKGPTEIGGFQLPASSVAAPSHPPGSDHFGLSARATARLPKGAWRIRTLSDDGVRVRVNGRPVIDNWSWHAPTRDEGGFTAGDEPTQLEVDYFEIDGHAVLSLSLERDR